MRRLVGLAAGLVVASSALAPLAFADHHEKAGHDHGGEGAATDGAMMKQWMEMGSGRASSTHRQFAGSWNAKVKMWMDQSAEPQESEGKATARWSRGQA
jgi:hypothetical protein